MSKIILILLLASCSLTDKPAKEPNNQEDTVKVAKTLPKPELKKLTNIHPGLELFCSKTEQAFNKYSWKESYCRYFDWHFFRRSNQGTPLVWYVLGDESLEGKPGVNTTLIMCGVHGDEIVPVKLCFDLLKDFYQNPELTKNKLIVVAPIVSPDSFFKTKPTRTNSKGVDVNRNFPTNDWEKDAIKKWVNVYKKDKRRFPGKKAMSEPETIFQMNLIKRYKPQKIISVHAPLTLLDYDGPKIKPHQHYKDDGKELLMDMSKKAGNYKVSDYPYFPGSLGNWAGNEQGIPTYTLELPNTDWNKTKIYWKQFKPSIVHAINQEVFLNPGASL